MRKILFSILCAFMVSTVASAQYLNVKMDDGTYRSFKTSAKTEVSFGEKKGAEVTESEQTVTVNGYTVAVKLADDTPASEMMLNTYVEDEKVKIEAFSKLNHGLWCSMDDNGEVPVTSASNGFHTFTLSAISKDMVVTVGYINVNYDLNNSGMDANFTVKPDDITKIGYNATIKEPDRLFSDKYGFRGWYKDKECTEAWNYSTGVTKSITLYAKWAEDPTGTQINGHDFVKLGGYYWATVNVGSCSNVTAVANPKTSYNDWGFYYYKQDGNAALDAAKSFGGTWTLPSEAQWQELINYCDWEWKTDYDYNGTKMNGMLVKGRVDTYESGHSLFLPAAGISYVGGTMVHLQGYIGYYWSTVDGRYLDFRSGDRSMRDDYDPVDGMAVRPVAE